MLAPNFRSAEELRIKPSQRDALIKVLGKLERGELHELGDGVETYGTLFDDDVFSMRSWQCCICGHAKRYAEFDESVISQDGPLGSLFYRTGMNMAQATIALRDYLVGV